MNRFYKIGLCSSRVRGKQRSSNIEGAVLEGKKETKLWLLTTPYFHKEKYMS